MRYVVSLIFLFFLTSHVNGQSVLWLPIEENIPYYDQDYISIEATRSFEELQQKPEELELLYKYLQNPGSFEPEKLDVMTGSTEEIILSIENDRLLILSPLVSVLIEYNLSSGTSTILAEEGRGPSDLLMPWDMIKTDNKLSVIRKDGYITIFDCQANPCKYEKAISMQVMSPTSFVHVNDTYAVLGKPRVSEMTNTEREAIRGKGVHILDEDGQVTRSFGEIYDIETDEVLAQILQMAEGNIQYNQAENVYILTFNRLPYIYIYDAVSFELRESYKMTDFLQGKRKYEPKEGRLWVIQENASWIGDVKIFGDELLLVEKITVLDQEYGKRDDNWITRDYYVVNLVNQGSWYLGGYKGGDSKMINVTENGLAIHNFEEGYLYWLGL